MKGMVLLLAVLLLLPFSLHCHSSSWQQHSNSTQENSTQQNSTKEVEKNSTEEISRCSRIQRAGETIEPFPYVGGGESKDEGGFDCSGAVYKVQKYIGEPVPRTTSRKMAIYASGERKNGKEGNCGDWIGGTFGPDRPFGHVGMHVEQPNVGQSGSSTGPHKETLFEESYGIEHFEVTKSPGLE